MSVEQNKAIVQRAYEEVWNQGNLDAADEFVAPEIIRHDPGTPDVTGGLEAHKQLVASIHAAFPDLHLTVEDMLAEGDKVAVRFTIRGTQKGEFAGIPPTNKQVEITGLEIAHIVDGKCIEHWLNWDVMGFMQQLGAIPPMGQSG